MIRIFEITIPSLIGVFSFGWLFWQRLKSSDDPAKNLSRTIISLAVLILEFFFVRLTVGTGNYGGVFMAAGSLGVCGLILGLIWRSQLGRLMVSPLNIFDGGNLPLRKPYYSSAVALRKSNQPLEAIAVIRGHLDKEPDDFEGVLLLAQIQAEDLKDLPSAEKVVNVFCESGQASREQVAVAFTLLADWQLKLNQNAEAAKAAFQHIVDKYPGTDVARAAQKRLALL